MNHFILFRDGDHRTPVEAKRIVRMQACGAYTMFFLTDGTSHKQCGNLSLWEEKLLEAALFVRIDRSNLINHLQVITFTRNGGVLMSDHTLIPLSLEGYTALSGVFER